MKITLLEYIKMYYQIANKEFVAEGSGGKYYVDRKNRISTIIFGYFLVFVSWFPFILDFLFKGDLLNEIIMFLSTIFLGLLNVNINFIL